MKDIPKQILVAMIVAVVIAAAGGGGWYFVNGMLNEALMKKQGLEAQINNVSRKSFFPTSDNLRFLNENVTQLESKIKPLEEKLLLTGTTLDVMRGEADAEGQFSGLTGDAWQKYLSAQQKEIKLMARKSGATLPEKFNVGFQRYSALLPNEAMTLPLGIQLYGISDLLKLFLDSGIQEIQEIKRVMVEDGDDAARASGENALGAQVVIQETGDYRVYPFEFSFRCLPANLYQLVSAITTDESLYLIRFLEIQNDKTSIPEKSEIISDIGDADVNIVPVLGQEMIRVRLRVDMVDWSEEKPQEGDNS
ncbi:MAG: hypothetical protein AAFY98_07720 [Verrucomicrobiota bacterium]